MVVGEWLETEREAVKRLRKEVTGPKVNSWSDGFFLRFLRAKQGKEEAAAEAMRETAIFRAAWGLDRPLQDFPISPVQLRLNKFHYPEGVTDREGNPVVLALFGAQDVRGLSEASNSFEYVLYSLVCLEKGLRLSEEVAKAKNLPYAQVTMIMDMDGMTSEHYTLKTFTNGFLTMTALQDAHFPLPYGNIVCIKAPTPFTYAYSLATPFLSSDITDVVKLPGADWAEQVKALIDPSIWPSTWGGEVASSGPNFPTSPLPLPEEEYLSGDDPELVKAEEVTIYPGAKHNVHLEAVKAGATLHFKYKTTGEDVGFAIYLEGEKGKDVIFPSIRLECSRLPVVGSTILPKAGNYVVELDNEYSWFSAKEIRFQFTLE